MARPPPPAFQVIAKPAGGACDLRCAYCFYRDRGAPPSGGARRVMSEEVLRRLMADTFRCLPGPEYIFLWQGGEPTLLGVDYFRRVAALGRELRPAGAVVTHAVQTHGIHLSDDWARLFADERFLIGVSLDGPADLHDVYRRGLSGPSGQAPAATARSRGTFDRVMRGIDALQRNGVPFATLTVVHAANAARPLDLYRFLKEAGSSHLQFIPLVEPEGPGVSSRSVTPAAWGSFLVALFDEWVRQDVGALPVQFFDDQLRLHAGLASGMCAFAASCGRAPVLDWNGDVYTCDHFVDGEHRLGNLLETPLDVLLASPQQRAFGRAKSDALPAECRQCVFLSFCHGECPKNRLTLAARAACSSGPELARSFLCDGYRAFFRHSAPVLRALVRGRRLDSALPAGRNAPCPCGSGRKHKHCHAAAH